MLNLRPDSCTAAFSLFLVNLFKALPETVEVFRWGFYVTQRLIKPLYEGTLVTAIY